MKKSTSSYSGTTPKKQPVSKPLSTGRVLSKVGPGGAGPSVAAVNRRSPVVLTDQTIATNSVIQAATDPKIKELVMKQQQEESRRESIKRPRADGINATLHVLDHPNSAPHHTHHGQQFWKHNSFEGTESLNMSLNASLNDTIPESEKSFSKYSTVSPDAHQQQKHYQFLEQAGGATPGSAMETVMVHGDGGAGGARAHQDDDGVNSEITVDAGYMMMHKVETAGHSQGQGLSPNNNPGPLAGSAGQGLNQGQQGAHMNMYMDMNSSLLHEHHNHANPSGTNKSLQSSPVTASMAQNHHANMPVPPPLNLPTAAHPPLAGPKAQTPTGHISAIAAVPVAQAQEPMMLPNPRALSDQALQAACVQFLLEMETRGLQSMNLNVASLMASQGNAANFSSSSSCMGAPAAHAVVPTSAPSPTLASTAGGAHYSAEVDMINRAAAQRVPVPVQGQANGNAKPAPATAHMGLAAGVAGANPVDIRKNVKRSKSNGSEAAFYPSAMFPGAPPNASAPVPTGASGPPSGRKTPNSPMLGRYSHASEGGAISYAQYLQQFGEPEEFELKDAFGQARHPGSPSYHSPYSPSHLSSNAPAPSYYQTHGHLHNVPQHGHLPGATPTSVTAGSANWAGVPNGGNPGTQAAPHAAPVAVPQNPNLSRSASRCSGVQPPMVSESRGDELLELRPGLRTNCLSTLPPTYSQYMYAHNSIVGANTQQATGATLANTLGSDDVSTASAEPRRVDLKTPKFVRKFQGIGAGLLGLTAALRFSSAEEEAEYTASTAAATRGRAAASTSASTSRSSTHAAPHTVHSSAHARDSNNHNISRTDATADNDNTIDAVRDAGGLDNLLLPGRAQHLLRSSVQPDEHSTFSQGSMSAFSQPSLNSTRSNSKKSSKTRS